MKEVPVRLGPLALLLTVISICMTTLAVLAFTTARADLSLAQQYAGTVQERYLLEEKGQQYLSETATDLAQGIMLLPDADGVIRNTIQEGETRLSIGLRLVGNEGYLVDSWRIERQWTEDTSIGNLWDGTWN